MAGSTPVYPPWQLFVWWMAFGAQAPRVFDVGGLIAAGGGVVAALVALIGRGGSQGASSTIHGSARWADGDDVAAAALRAGSGIFLGRFAGRYLRHAGPRSEEHTSEIQSLM